MAHTTVGIVTINDYKNYGNRLQNYALTRLLEAEGFHSVNLTSVATKEKWRDMSTIRWKWMVKNLTPLFCVRKLLSQPPRPRDGLMGEREQCFRKFTEGYTTILPPIVENTDRAVRHRLEKLGVSYFIAGSDQVWNPIFQGRDIDFLTFAPPEKRLSFAASIGVDEIPDSQLARYGQLLREMKYLSVREQRAVEIIKELTGRDADLTLDPTLLLEPEEWTKVVKKPVLELDEHYICTYFLGETPEVVQQFAREKGLRIYTLNSQESPELFVLDPGEFLYMIKNAAYVLTDSFHAVAFSIKFHKEFYVFCRKQANTRNMFSRIETITQRFGLGNRIQSRDAIVDQPPVEHWETIDREMLTEKTASMQRLINAMETA